MYRNMSYYVPVKDLNRQQMFSIGQKVSVVQDRGRGFANTLRLNYTLQVGDVECLVLPYAVNARLGPAGLEEPFKDYRKDPAPNSQIIYDVNKTGVRPDFKLRGNQPAVVDEALEKLSAYGTCLLELSCSYGKTCMSIYIAQKTGLKWLFVTPRKVLKKQTLRDGAMVTDARIQIIESKGDIDPAASGYIISSHIMKRFTYEELAHIGTVILDEVHMLFTTGFIPNLQNVLFPRYLIALSATPDRKDGLDAAIPLYIDKRSYIQAFIVRPCKLVRVSTSLKLKVKLTKLGEVDWTDILRQQAECSWRNHMIAFLAKLNLDMKPLVLCGRRDQVRDIYTHLVQMGVRTDTFMESDDDFNRDSQVLVAIMSKIGVGFDGDFNCVIFASDVTDVRQMVGRVGRRLKDDTVRPVVIDLVDNFGTMKKHFNESRLPQYQRFCDAKKIVEYTAEPNLLFMYD